MKRSVVIIQGLQVAFVGLAVWNLLSLKLASSPLEFTWIGVLVPSSLFALHGSGLATSFWKGSLEQRQRWAIRLALIPLGCVVVWWLLLAAADSMRWDRSPYRWFFVQNGNLPANEIFGSESPLVIAIVWHSLAASLGVPLWFIFWRQRRRTSGTG